MTLVFMSTDNGTGYPELLYTQGLGSRPVPGVGEHVKLPAGLRRVTRVTHDYGRDTITIETVRG